MKSSLGAPGFHIHISKGLLPFLELASLAALLLAFAVIASELAPWR
jgi:hypothetical protein